MSWRSMVALLAALVVTMPVLSDQASAQRRGDRDRGADRGGGPGRGPERTDDWELLGSTRIGGFGVDRDVIGIGRREGRFSKIGIEVRDGSVFLLNVTVVYRNNESERFDLRQRLRKGERTPPLDLKGRGRAIKRIEIAARARRSRHRHRAVLDVYGQQVRDNWELLGEKRVGRRTDRDVIRVGRKKGRFEKIRLEVKDNDVEINGLKVFFDRRRLRRRGGRDFLGQTAQDVRVRGRIREGGRTRPIDLAGGERIIDRIELVYRTRGRGGRATVAVYGLKSSGRKPRGRPPGPPPRAQWEELGCQKVGFGADRDTIRVGREEGRFSAIRLRAKRSDVLILSLKVVYEHGPADDFDVKSHIRAGSQTRPLDLRGERRAIKKVELVYSSIPSLRGAARLCVDGRP